MPKSETKRDIALAIGHIATNAEALVLARLMEFKDMSRDEYPELCTNTLTVCIEIQAGRLENTKKGLIDVHDEAQP